MFGQNAVWGHPLHKIPSSFVLGPFTPVSGGNGNTGSGATRVYSITGTRLSTGRGVLLWIRGSDSADNDSTGGYLEGAYTDTVYDFLKNNVVTSADIVTWDPAWYYKGAVRVWTDDRGDVFYTMLYNYDDIVGSGQRGFVKIFKADDPLDPLAGWTLYSTVQSNGAPTATFDGYWEPTQYPVAGKPYFASPTRWVYVGGRWANGGSSRFICQAGYWYSDDRGVTWTFVMQNSNSTYTNYLPGQIARSPTNGYLYSQDSYSSVNQNGDIWESQDDGVTWTSVHTYAGVNNATPFWCLYEDPYELTYNCIFALDVDPSSPAGGRRVFLFTDDYIYSTVTKWDASYSENVAFGNSPTITMTAKAEIFEVML